MENGSSKGRSDKIIVMAASCKYDFVVTVSG
jgi:hypothetical protein